MQAGVRLRSWLSFGFDYSVYTGHTSLGTNLFTTALQQQLNGQIAQLIALGRLPANYTLSVPIDSLTQTFAAGPQLAFHGWSLLTLYLRPSLGMIRETATPHAIDPFSAAVIAQLAPSGSKQDWTPFYGFGGGFDVNVTNHLAVRVSADFVHDHLFSDLLKDGRNTFRISVGPAWQFGHNIQR